MSRKNRLYEKRMREKGVKKVWKDIFNKSHNIKTVDKTQVGQQLLFDDALKMLPLLEKWVERYKKSKTEDDGENVKVFFEKKDKLLIKTTAILFYLSTSTKIDKTNLLIKSEGEAVRTKKRHRDIDLIKSKVLPELSFDAVWRLVEHIVYYSKYFEKKMDKVVDNDSVRSVIYYTCSLPNHIVDELAQKSHAAFYPEPMLDRPVNWKFREILRGGYSTFQMPLVRTKEDIDYKAFSRRIFRAVNYIQSVPWQINKDAISAIKRDLKEPLKEDFVFKPYPDPTMAKLSENLDNMGNEEREQVQEYRKVFYEELEHYRGEMTDYVSAKGKYDAVMLAVGIAERYVDEEELYFPHSYDSRGRIYPIPVGLTPQGSDPIKSLLEYKEGEVLTERGELWAWAYLTSLYGEDKLDFEDRARMGKELINSDHMGADEPFQFLIHQIELRRFLDDRSYKFKGRVHLDACNSGSQFSSAITGDESGCRATNVIPTFDEKGKQVRQDAYLLVSDKVSDRLIEEIRVCEDQVLKNKLVFFHGVMQNNGRKLCKTPVMVSNYGGTDRGRITIVQSNLRELKVDREMRTMKSATILSKLIGESIRGVLNGGKAFEIYIQAMSALITGQGDDINVRWRTSDGFCVINSKRKIKTKSIHCSIPNFRRELQLKKAIYTDNVDSRKVKSSISPNYIHSLDAQLLRSVALRMQKEGIKYHDWIHDSFGCHPNHVDLMLDIIKDEFIKLMKSKPLKRLHEQLIKQLDLNNHEVKTGLKKISLPMNKKFNYGFQALRCSNWFFS